MQKGRVMFNDLQVTDRNVPVSESYGRNIRRGLKITQAREKRIVAVQSTKEREEKNRHGKECNLKTVVL